MLLVCLLHVIELVLKVFYGNIDSVGTLLNIHLYISSWFVEPFRVDLEKHLRWYKQRSVLFEVFDKLILKFLAMDLSCISPRYQSTLPSPMYSTQIQVESEWIPGRMVGMVGIW